MIDYKITIGGIDYTADAIIPFTEQYVLDQALDNGVLNINGIERAEVFKPFTLVEIKKDADIYKMYVGQDISVEVVGAGLYNHKISLIEETKILEKKVVDTNTTTQVLFHDYFAGISGVYIKRQNLNIGATSYRFDDRYQNIVPLSQGTLTFISVFDWFGSYGGGIDEGDISISKDGVVVATQSNILQTLTLTLETGSYSVSYVGRTYQYPDYEESFQFACIAEIVPPPNKTITEVVNRLLAITETLRASETPKLTFDSEQAEYYSNIVAPEFSMTKNTLRECLDQVGAYIHSIVRLENGVIKFDKLGGSDEAEAIDDYCGKYDTQDCEQYASQLDSIVDNITNIEDEADGTIIEPFNYGLKTLRADGTIRIGDGDGASAMIETTFPIEKIKKLTIGYISVGGQAVSVGDITPYVYENAEYQALSATGGVFPYSRGYAIYYTQGEKNIKGLLFKLPNPISSVFENQAILNIISTKIGQAVQTLFNVQNITEINYNLEYYPSTTARVKQSKTNLNDFDEDITTIYNQSANKVDSRFYGENLKGAIARLGNVEKKITEHVKDESQLKNVGELIGDYYISTIDIENMRDEIKVTYGLSKDFNALSKYIGIRNNIRMYEVSEKQSVERFVTYEDYCVIGDEGVSDGKQLLTSKALGGIRFQFYKKPTQNISVSVARVQTFDKYGISIGEFDLPVFTLGIGNSIWFGFKFDDNFSAGNTSETGTNATGSAYYRVQNYAQYCDTFGEIETIKIRMFDYLQKVEDLSTVISSGNALPRATLEATQGSYIDTQDDNIVIKKDNRENISFSYQVHFVTNKDNFVIGSRLSQGNILVARFEALQSYADLYVLPRKINKFEKLVDLTGATKVHSNIQAGTADNKLHFGGYETTANGQSWAYIDHKTGELLFGENGEFKVGDTVGQAWFTFTHKIA